MLSVDCVEQKFTVTKMSFLHCCLLFAVFIQSSPTFVNAQYLLDTVIDPGATATNVRGLAAAIYHFTVDLYTKILESHDDDGNVFFSPTSIYVALAMLYAGSGGETKKQLASALYVEDFYDENEFYESIKILLQTLSSTKKKYNLKIANRLYGQKGFTFEDEYLKMTADYFRAELETLDFAKDPSGSRSKINKWVARMTSDKIKELFPKDGITRDTVLALANAVYFNASWLYKFDVKETRPQTFAGDQKIQVPMMHLLQSRGLRYSRSNSLKFRLLQLPYVDENVSTIIILNDENGDFNYLLRAHIIDGPWDELVHETTNMAVRLSLPKFNLQQSMDLKDTLSDFGLKNLFQSADLSGIAESASLELSKAYHKAFIAVGELGTEAAAATGFMGIPLSSQVTRVKFIDFIVDRPFELLVVEKTTGSILFFGHIKNPVKSN